ncbi:hypothetical protein NC651_005687 [Populus alba x Populus x berolinensis]|nr:hypothetical protein NC651_005687 [Populus alba x Populus x berolinensis]
MTKVALLEVGRHKISGETSMNPNATLGGFREPLYSVLRNFTSLLYHWSASDMGLDTCSRQSRESNYLAMQVDSHHMRCVRLSEPTILFSHLYEEATLCYCLAGLIFEGKKEKRKRNTVLHDHSMRIRVPADPGKSRLLVKSNLDRKTKKPNPIAKRSNTTLFESFTTLNLHNAETVIVDGRMKPKPRTNS